MVIGDISLSPFLAMGYGRWGDIVGNSGNEKRADVS